VAVPAVQRLEHRIDRGGIVVARPTHAYVSTTRCGCVIAATVDNPLHAHDVRQFVNNELISGCSINRVTIEDVRQMVFGCEHKEHTELCPQCSAWNTGEGSC
jgi:hypothetical protein